MSYPTVPPIDELFSHLLRLAAPPSHKDMCHSLHGPPPSYDPIAVMEYNEFLRNRASKQTSPQPNRPSNNAHIAQTEYDEFLVSSNLVLLDHGSLTQVLLIIFLVLLVSPDLPVPTFEESIITSISPAAMSQLLTYHRRSCSILVLDNSCYVPDTVLTADLPPLGQSVALQKGKSTVGCRWVYAVKVGPDGQVDWLKARLVTKGYTQICGLDYSDTFPPVAKIAFAMILRKKSIWSNHLVLLPRVSLVALYALDILEATRMIGCRPIDTCMDPNAKLLPGQGESLSDPEIFRRLVEKLNYLTVTRPDISFSAMIPRQSCLKVRYPVVPTLLTRILWWRICLDEAQMVENNAAAATEMALRLHGVHRWCITGTPIQRKLDDLFGLLRFLNASPFNTFRWWTDVICDPYERGDSRAMVFAHDFFKRLMWRSSKVHVADELQLPPQEECVSWLSLSPIEEHFYQRQHDTCVNDARELIGSSQLEDAASDVVITNIEAAKLFNSLLKLRQACCHPQVGSSGLRSLQQSPMTMEEILSVLVSKTKVEGEEALRRLVVAMNALAGIAIINQNYSQAVSLYQEALALAEDHSEDFRLDPLLNIHITHNLSEVLPVGSDSSQKLECAPASARDKVSNIEDAEESDKVALFSEDKAKEKSMLLPNSNDPSNLMSNSLANDSVDENSDTRLNFFSKCTMTTACEKLKEKFLSAFNLKLAGAQQEFKKSYDQVCNAFSDRKNQYTAWWLEALHHIEQNKDSSNELIRKIGETVSGTLNTSRASKIASWLIANKACLIHENLQRMGWQMNSRCSPCNRAREDNSHLFLHCRATDQPWQCFDLGESELGDAKEHFGFTKVVEGYSSLHLVDSLERKKC
ncbi:hypothetical protein FXO38_36222 [Capsicum annuum]|nr:hypothetical protein FXO38_36222 [Capsicum annuum]